MAIEIVDFPINSMVDLSIAMLNYQRVLYQNLMTVVDREAVSRIGHRGCRRWRQYLEWSGDNGGQCGYIWVNYNDLTATSLEVMVRIREIIPKWPNYSGWWNIIICPDICFKWISLTKIRWPSTKLGFSLEIKAQKISARIVLAGHFQQQPSKNDCRSSPIVIHVHLRWESLYFTTRMALSIKRWKTIRV